MHVHIEVDSHGHASLPQPLLDASSEYFKAEDADPDRSTRSPTYYREREHGRGGLHRRRRHPLGHEPNSNEEIAEGAARNNDVLIPFGSVDPLTGEAAVERGPAPGRGHGVRGFKFHPSCRASTPSDRDGLPALRGDRRSSACRRSSTPARPASAPGCPAAAGSG